MMFLKLGLKLFRRGLRRVLGYLVSDSGSYITDDNGNRIKGDL